MNKLKKSALLLPAIGAATQLFAASKPNVILILADDMGYGDVSALNPESKINTSNIDELGRNGVIFSDAHASSSLSTPSRYSILTGRYSWRGDMKFGVLNGYKDALIEEGRSTLATMFSQCGYETACYGKWHLGWEWAKAEGASGRRDVDFSKPVRNGVISRGGFDHFFGIVASLDMPPYVYVDGEMPTSVPDHTAPGMTGLKLFRSGPMAPDFDPQECLPKFFEKGTEFINSMKDSNRPFFLYLPINAPHTPVLPAKEFQGKSGIGPYGDYILEIDSLIGDLVRTLKENGQWDNTILVFTTDNGCAPAIDISILENQGHYPSYIYRGYKTDIYDGGHRIPLIVTWGDRIKPHRDASLVCLSDFFATFSQIAGYTIRNNEAEDSFSFLPALTGKGRMARKDIIHLSGKGALSLRRKNSKLIFYAGSGGGSYPTADQLEGLPGMQLYDMESDPSEKNNLIEESRYHSLVKRLSKQMRKYVNEGRTTPGAPQKCNITDWEFTREF